MALSRIEDQFAVLSQQQQMPGLDTRILKEIKASIQFQYRWEEPLSCGSVAINNLGACVVASASDKADSQLQPPRDGFKYLTGWGDEYSLRQNLVHGTNLGKLALIEVERSMGVIRMVSATINSKTEDAIKMLWDPSNTRILRPQIEQLRSSSSRCYEAAREMDNKFEDWLWHTCELHAACVSVQTAENDDIVSKAIEAAATQLSLEYPKDTAAVAKQSRDKLEKQIDATTEAYKNASDEFPSGWDFAGHMIVDQLADSNATALNAAISGLVDGINPITKAKVAFMSGPRDAEAKPIVNTPANTRPKDADDPAYSQAARDLPFFHLLSGFFIDKNGGIDWNKARGGTSNLSAGIAYAQKGLSNAITGFASIATKAEPSTSYSRALNTASQVATTITSELRKFGNSPANDSDMAKNLQSDFAAAYSIAIATNATAKTFPGVPSSGVVVDTARARWGTSQAALTAAQETYRKASEVFAQQQTKILEFNTQLSRLTSGSIGLVEIKEILVRCIVLICQLKAQIVSLVRFFSTMTTIIEFVLQKHVGPYTEAMKVMSNGQPDPGAGFQVGSYTLIDLQRSNIINSLLITRAYYSVFGDFSSKWATMAPETISPGIQMLDQMLSMSDNKSMVKMMAGNLEKWAPQAAKRVNSVAEQTQERVRGDMSERIDGMAKVTRLLPTSPAVTKAIEQGSNISRDAAQNGFQAIANSSLLAKYSSGQLR